MRKLYIVTAQFMILAYNKDDIHFHRVNLEDCDLTINKSTKCFPGWEDAYPLGEPSSLTCSELLKRLEP